MHCSVMRNLTVMLPARVTASCAGTGTAVKTMSAWVLVRRRVGRRAWKAQRAEPCPGQVHLTDAGLGGQQSRAGLMLGLSGPGRRTLRETARVRDLATTSPRYYNITPV